jgi:hypothetical protein
VASASISRSRAGCIRAALEWAPEASDPTWRGPDGRSHKLGEVLAGLGEASRELILATHAEAVGEIVRAAAAAKASGRAGAVAPHAAAASRLVHQLAGQGY